MKRVIAILVLTCICIGVYAQTPYDSFAPETSRPILDMGTVVSNFYEEHVFDTSLNVAVIDTSFTDDIRKWMSVDPLADKYPNISPYSYCGWNPVNRIDPDGKLWETAWDIANVGMDIQSLRSNVSEGNVGAAVVDGIGLIIDGAAMLTPLAPAGAGAIINAYRTAEKVSDAGKATNKFRQAVMRGIQSEKRVLKDMGLTKNTSKIASTTKDGTPINVIPDAVKDGVMYEIKDTKAVYDTKQIQGEYQAAKKAGYDFKIVTGEKTHVSPNIPSDVEIIRRSDLGPQ